MSSKLIPNLVALLLIILIGYFGWWYLTRPQAPVETGLPSITVQGADGTASSTENPADTFARLLHDLQGVTFQQDEPGRNIFTNPTFRAALEDYSLPLPIIDTARVNPFAPVGPLPPGTVRYPTHVTTVASSSPFGGRAATSSVTTATTSKPQR